MLGFLFGFDPAGQLYVLEFGRPGVRIAQSGRVLRLKANGDRELVTSGLYGWTLVLAALAPQLHHCVHIVRSLAPAWFFWRSAFSRRLQGP